jgi:hypothetical protein
VPRKITRRLTALERAEAKLVVEAMLCKRVDTRTIETALQEQYAMSVPSARHLVKVAIAEMQAAVAAAAPHRRAQQIASLDRLYERALDAGKFMSALGVQRLLAKIEGTEKPRKHQHSGIPAPVVAAVSAVDPEFEGKSEDELNYYAEHGWWPGEGPDDDEDQGPAEPVFPIH